MSRLVALNAAKKEKANASAKGNAVRTVSAPVSHEMNAHWKSQLDKRASW